MKILKNRETFSYNDLEADLKRISKYELLREYLPFLEILPDHKTILTKNNSLVRVLKITGVDSANMSEDRQEELFNIRNNLFSLTPNDVRLSFYNHRRKLVKNDPENPTFSNPYAEKISDQWYSQFENSYITETFLILTKNYPSLTTQANQFLVRLNAARKDFEINANQVKAILSRFGINDLDNQNNYELFKFFSFNINCFEFASKSNSDLFNHFSLSDISFNQSSGLIKIQNDRITKYSKILGVRIDSNNSDEKLFRKLLTLDHEFTIVQQVKTYSKEQNRREFRSMLAGLDQQPQFSSIESRKAELKEALELIETDITNFIDYTCYIKIFGNSPEELEQSVAAVQSVFINEGIIAISETIGVVLAFFSSLPDMEFLLTRLKSSNRIRINTQNVSDFVTLYSVKEGYRRCPFGEMPVVDFKTTSNSIYSFTFHKDDSNSLPPGHTIVIGDTGSGKSTLMSFLLMNCLKFPKMKMLCFDSNQGLKVPVNSFGGQYVTVGKDSDLKLNPMTLEDTSFNRSFLREFIKMLAGGIEEKEETIINDVINTNYELNPENRSLRELAGAFDLKGFDEQTKRQKISSRLAKWTSSSRKNDFYSNFFNSEIDSLNFHSNMVCFDLSQILNDAELLAPTSLYIFHKFNRLIESDPSPHIFFIDEMKNYLENQYFSSHIVDTIGQSRKNNGIYIGCMLVASTLLESKVSKEIINNLATLILFPDPAAKPQEYITGLGLTYSEFNFIKTSPASARNVLIKKKEGHSVIVNIDLTILGNDLKLLSTKASDRIVMEQLIKQFPDNWIENYLNK